MTEARTAMSRVPAHKSIFFTSTFVVALCTALVALSLEVSSILSSQEIANATTRSRGLEVSNLLAQQAGGAVRFGKVDALQTLLDGTTASAYASAAVVVKPDGTVLAQSGAPIELSDAQRQTIVDAMQSGEVRTGSDDFFVAMPTLFGKEHEVVGAIAILWTSAPLLEKLKSERIGSIARASFVFLAGLIGAAIFLRWRVSKPLVRIQEAIEKISEKQYDVYVPGARRDDEIGQISRTVTGFRDELSKASADARDSLFKSAAFEGSSAAMLMTDSALNILYVNSAARCLLARFAAQFRVRDPDFDADTLVGRSALAFIDPEYLTAELATDPEHLPCQTDIRMGDSRLNLTVNAVQNASGAMLGCVLEWADVTDERLNLAVIDAINEDQILVEFDVRGKMLDANENFRRALKLPEGDPHNLKLNDLLREYRDGGASDTLDWSGLQKGGRLHRRFVAINKGVSAIIDGAVSQVRDAGGETLRVILIGNDITASQAAIDMAEATRAELMAMQAQVVDTLSVELDKLAEGDLSVQIGEELGSDYEELRTNFNNTVDRLRDAMTQVIASADLISSEASSISASANNLSERTERQASTLEETAAAIDVLSGSVRSAATSANQASEMANAARDSAEHSETVARDTVAAMDEIARSSDEISKIINVIEDIAFQTNLLALNAGVEAARAGESGRGFAVVASEVRALAQRSSSAAQEINQLISKSGSHVDRGVGLVGQMGTALRGIVSSITDISSHVSGIAISVQEQSGSLDEVNSAMSDLDRVTQQNAAMFEETTAASHALTGEARTLGEMTGRFRVGGDLPSNTRLLSDKTGAWVSASRAAAPVKKAAPSDRRKPAAHVADAPEAEADWDNAMSF